MMTSEAQAEIFFGCSPCATRDEVFLFYSRARVKASYSEWEAEAEVRSKRSRRCHCQFLPSSLPFSPFLPFLLPSTIHTSTAQSRMNLTPP